MALPTKPDNLPTDMENPVRGEPRATFAAKANTFLQRLVDEYTPDLNALADWFNQMGGEIETLGTNAEQSATDAANAQSATEGFRDEAEGFRNEAAAIAGTLPEGAINDSVTTLTDTWSSQKISDEIAGAPAGLVPLLTVNASAVSAIDFTDLDTYGFDNFQIRIFAEGTLSSDTSISIRFSTDNGSTFIAPATGAYQTTVMRSEFTPPSTTNIRTVANNASIPLVQISNLNISSCILNISNALVSNNTTVDFTAGSVNSFDGQIIRYSGFGLRQFDEIHNAVRFLASSGSITGTLTLYGVAEA